MSLIRSSAVDYLTFVATSGRGGVEAAHVDESIWLTQKMMGLPYDVNVRTPNERDKQIFADSEPPEDSAIRKSGYLPPMARATAPSTTGRRPSSPDGTA